MPLAHDELLAQALDAAIAKHFSTLFEVLLVDPSPNGLQRFQAGLKRLAETENAVREVIRKL